MRKQLREKESERNKGVRVWKQTDRQTAEEDESETEGESPERMGDSLKRQIPTVGSRRWEDKQ